LIGVSSGFVFNSAQLLTSFFHAKPLNMKADLKISIACIVALLITFSSYSFVHVSPPNSSSPVLPSEIMDPSPFAGMTLTEFLKLSPRKYRVLTGKNMSLSQKIALKFAQYKVKKLIRKNKHVDLRLITKSIDGNDFHIPGFIIGIVLGPVGVLIAYLIEGKNSSMFQWSLIGGLIWLGLFLLVMLIL
jgi:hypothetical protein